MENLDLAVLRALRDWRAADRRALLATVVRTWGSSPRPIGSVLALRDDGVLSGTVSGGCIEDDLIYRFRGAIHFGRPEFVKYGVSADEAHRFGLPCGGTLELLLEFNPGAQGLRELVCALESGELMQRTVRVSDGAVSLQRADIPQDLSFEGGHLSNTFGPEFRMLLIGAGQLTEYVATMALFSGFSVTVCDPREEYRGSWGVPGVRVVNEMPDDVVAGFRPDRRTCVVALTHDPKLDDLALLEALRTDAFYVGAIGSRRNNAGRHERMKDHFGLDDAKLSRLRGPIGIYIGSKTPPEIAVSVMAEILATRNGVSVPRDMDVATAKSRQIGDS